MRNDPIVAEVRKHREKRAARFGFNVRAIALDAKKRETKSGHKVVSFVQKQATA